MSIANVLPDLSEVDSRPVSLACSEVWGGNQSISRPVELPGIRGVIYSRPCYGGLGGDVHYLSVCSSGLLSRMCVADVVGHGEAVASVSREMHALLRRFMNQPDQRRVLADLNRRVQQMGLGAMTTAAAFSYYPTTRRLSFSYAGHPPAWFFCGTHHHWLRLDGPQSRGGQDCPSDMPLGIDGRTRYSTGRIEIHPGDRLLILTDGVLEVPDAQGDLFGEARLEQLLQQYESESCDGLAGALRAELAAHAGRSELDHDDVTFLAIEFTEAPRGPAAWHAVRNRLLRRRGTVGVVAR